MKNKTKLTPELMFDMGFWKSSYTNIWYHGEHGIIDDVMPCGIYIDDCERPRYRVILGETVFCCTYKEDLIEEFNITLQSIMAKTEWIWDELYTIDDIVRHEFEYCGYSEHVLKRVIETLKKNEADKREIVEHVEDIEKKRLFNNIDDVIAYLQTLKSQGYTNLEERWCGYEDNYIVACKNEIETNEEFYHRICKEGLTLARTYSDEEAEKKKIQAEIKKKQKEIEELKKKL